jgi:C-terminal processing protease CtpA/Prc
MRYGFIDHSIALVTEGLGPHPFHGRIAILVNQHSTSAAEMVAAFAQENGLATIVGTRTPGRLVGSRPFKLQEGYFLVLPVGAYLTWGGRILEGSGIKPDIELELSLETLLRGCNNQLDKALQIVTQV